MTKDEIEKKNKLFGFYSMFVDVKFKPKYNILGKIFGKDMKELSNVISKFSTDNFNGKFEFKGNMLDYDCLDYHFANKKNLAENIHVQILPGNKEFTAYT